MLECGIKKVEFTIPGKAQAQQRVKVYSNRGFTRGVDPKESRVAKAKIKAIAQELMDKNRITIMHKDMPVSMIVNVYKAIPTGKPKWFKVAAENQLIVPTVKNGDVDNLAKLIQDALSGTVYVDDCQIYYLQIKVLYSENPHTDVSVWGHYINLGDVRDGAESIIKMQKELEGTSSENKSL